MTMIEEITKDKERNTRLYKAQADEHKGDALAVDIITKANALMEHRGRVDFNNLEDVKAKTLSYFQACSVAKAYPTVMGLAVNGFGISRQALNQYMLKHPDTATTEFINRAKDVMADILTNESLYNNANAIQVIFQLKNHFGHTDKVEIEPVRNEPLPTLTQEQLIEQSIYLPD